MAVLKDYLGRGIATIGESLGLPEWGISEKITGVPSQTVPLSWNPQGAYQSPQASTPTYSYSPAVLGTSTKATTPASPIGGTPTTTMSLREQMEKGLIPWDDNLLNAGNGGGGGGTDPYAKVRSDIESGYSSYFAQLDAMMNEGLLAGQQTQQQIVEKAYESGLSQLGTQKTLSDYELGREEEKIGARQTRTLKDISSNLRNLFMAGNNYLGAMGAGDSSAANQYAYALTKLGSKQRGDVLRQTSESLQSLADQKFRLQTIYDSESRKLKDERDTRVLEIGEWFNNQQQTLRQAKASGELAKSTDLTNLSKSLLDQALRAMMQVDSYVKNQSLILQTWATSQSTNINQLQQNMAAVGAWQSPGLNYSPLIRNPINNRTPFANPAYFPGSTSSTEGRFDLFGNPIS